SRHWDYQLIVLWFAAVTVGLVMVASASFPSGSTFGGAAHFAIRHAIYLSIGTLALGVCASVPLRLWQDVHRELLIATLILGVLVLVPGIGQMVNGSRRWIGFGVFSVQVAEIAKFALI